MVATKVKIKKDLLNKIESSFSYIYEDGGILGGNEEEITDFYIVKGNNKYSFEIDSKVFSQIYEKWSESNIDFLGFIHSHTNCNNKVSLHDYMYVSKFLEANPELDELLFAVANKDKGIQFYLFKDKDYKEIELDII